MKQITIYDLLPLLKKGWVAMDNDGTWCWFSQKPNPGDMEWLWVGQVRFLDSFNIKMARKWKDSLIKVEHSKKENIDRKDFEDFIEQHGVSPYGFLTEAILKEDFECWKKRRKNDKDTY